VNSLAGPPLLIRFSSQHRGAVKKCCQHIAGYSQDKASAVWAWAKRI